MDPNANTRMQQTCQAWSTRYWRYSLISVYSIEVDGGMGYGRCFVFLATVRMALKYIHLFRPHTASFDFVPVPTERYLLVVD